MEGLKPEDIAALKRDIMSSLHCALPGIVESFDAETGTAVIRPAVRYHRNAEGVILSGAEGGVEGPLNAKVNIAEKAARSDQHRSEILRFAQDDKERKKQGRSPDRP